MTTQCLRGGSLVDTPRWLRSTVRFEIEPDDRYNYGGFRVAGRPGAARSIRGGSWLVHVRDERSTSRFWHGPGYRSDTLGFRLVVLDIKS